MTLWPVCMCVCVFCCRPAGPGDQALQAGGGLLVLGAPRPEGQHGEGAAHHGVQEHGGAPAGGAAQRGVAPGAGGQGAAAGVTPPARPHLVLLFFLLSSRAGRLLPSPARPLLLRLTPHPHLLLLLLLIFPAPTRPNGLGQPRPHQRPLPRPAQRGEWSKHEAGSWFTVGQNI